jgi:anaerobic ribonucleoside-triphosphate reductase activating protein
MRIARFEAETLVEGPGKRTAVWMQGCSIGCLGCCNPQMHDFAGGCAIDVNELAEKICNCNSDGLTLLGGEPMDQVEELILLLQKLSACYNKTIMLFSGYNWEKIERDADMKKAAMLCDLVIAGPYLDSQQTSARRWIGSANQTVHFFSDRFADLQKQWPAGVSEIEIVIADNLIMINGTPLDHGHELSRIFQAKTENSDA